MSLNVAAIREWLTAPETDVELPEANAEQLQTISRKAWRLLAIMLAATLVVVLFPVQGAVLASGEVSVDSRVKTITHPTGGVLSRVLVREGQRVKAGQVLMELDQTVLGPSARNAALSRDQLLALRARLEAERDDRRAITFPEALTARQDAGALDAMERERRQFELGRAERDNGLSLLQQRIRQYEEQINSYRIQIDATKQQLVLIQPELEGLRSLKERGLVTINRLNQMERTAVQLTATEASLQADIAQAEAQISETREQILNVSQTRRVDAGQQLANVIAQLAEQDSRAVSIADSLDRATITAPQAGIVDQIVYTTRGSAIPPNEPVVRLVPDEDVLVITARVGPNDVDALRVGQAARVRFSTIDKGLSPEVEGKLGFLAAERTDDPQSGVSYYRVRVEVEKSALEEAGVTNLRVGQPVEVFLKTSTRSILSWALGPLMDQMGKAMRE
jgi:HlyD family secretion protein